MRFSEQWLFSSIYSTLQLSFTSPILVNSHASSSFAGFIHFIILSIVGHINFRCRLGNSKFSVYEKIQYSHARWSYFLGYGIFLMIKNKGFPSALSTYLFPEFLNAGIYAFIFPLVMIYRLNYSTLLCLRRPNYLKIITTLFIYLIYHFSRHPYTSLKKLLSS